MYIKNDMFHLSFLTKLVMISILSFPIIQNHIAMIIGYLKRHVGTGKGINSLGKEDTRPLFDFPVTYGSLLSTATVF